MMSCVLSCITLGFDAYIVRIETDLNHQLPRNRVPHLSFTVRAGLHPESLPLWELTKSIYELTSTAERREP